MEDKYGVSPFKRAEDSVIGNKAFEDAVDAEVKRILNDKEEMKKFFSEVNKISNEIHANSTRVASFIEVTDKQKKAFEDFEAKMLDGMKEAQETEREISDYMEKNNLEPVSMEELIYGDDESRQDVQKNVQIQENVQKTDVNLDKTEPKKAKKRPITVK